MITNILEEPAVSIIKVEVYHLPNYSIIIQEPTI